MRNPFRRPRFESEAHDLYTRLVNQARRPEFYVDMAVPDTPEGRFDLILLHVFLLMNRLNDDPDRTAELSQCLFDVMFGDMDTSLREMGVGDIGVGKRIKRMVQDFYGRVTAYEEALHSGGDGLKLALERNIYGTPPPQPVEISALEAYVAREWEQLKAQSLDQIVLGQVSFGPPILPLA